MEIQTTRKYQIVIHTAIVILNWNTRHQLAKFLPFLLKYTPLGQNQIFVADNASTDDSVDFVKLNFPDVQLITLDKNYGFAEGYNRALSQIEAKYYILLNSDIEVTENWFPPLIRLLESDSQIAACMPKFLSYTDRENFEYAGAAGGYIDYLGYPFCKGRIFDSLEKDNGQYNGTYEVFWATGACMAVRADVYHKLGGLDAFFFAHMEEIDICWRMLNAGYKIYCTTESVLYHIGGGTLPKGNPHKTFLNFRNNLILLYKNLPENKRYIIAIRFILNFLSIIKYLLAKMPEDANAVFNAYKGFYEYKSKFPRHQKINTYPSVVYNKSVVWKYFVQKVGKFSDLRWNK
jgi:GT2 family glycosyltransferase